MRKFILMLPILLAALLLHAAQLKVVGEVFTTVCTGCGGDYSVARSALIQLSEEHPYIIPVIWNMTDETSPGGVERFEWYGGTEDPLAEWSGVLSYVGEYDVINEYYDLYTQLVDEEPPMKVVATMTLGGGRDNSVIIDALVELYQDIDPTDNRITFLLTRNDLTNYHGLVLLKSDDMGFELHSGGELDYFQHEFEIDAEWDIDDLRGVVIVQNWQTKEIMQASQAQITLPVGEEESVSPPSDLSVSVYPNPFNPQTNISFEIPEDAQGSPVTVDVFNVRGQKVRSLYKGVPAGAKTSLVWNGTDDNGRNVGSGVYYTMVLSSGRSPLVKKIVLLK